MRLLSSRQFQNVKKSRKKINCNYFTVYFSQNEDNKPRLGLILTKREIPKAVQRNRFKRIIRESFRLNQHQISCMDYVIFVSRNALKIDAIEFRALIDKNWEKIR